MRLTDETLPLLDEMREVNAYGGIVQPEACAIHRDRIKRRAADIDPNVRVRLERGCAVSAADYFDMMQARTRLVRAMDQWLTAFDVLVMPTTPIVAPTIAEVTGSGGLRRAQHPRFAQYLNRQLFRPLRHLAAAQSQASSRSDADGTQ